MPEGQQDTGATTEDSNGGGDDQGQQQAKTYTQEELNALIETRLGRERAKYADYGDLKRKVTEAEKVLQAQMSDQEKAIAAARTEGEQTATAKFSRHMITAEARALAAARKFRDPSDAVAFLGDLSGIKIDIDTGAVDTKTLQSALDDLAKNKSYLLAEDKNPRPAGDAGQGPRSSNGVPSMNNLIHDLATRGGS